MCQNPFFRDQRRCLFIVKHVNGKGDCEGAEQQFEHYLNHPGGKLMENLNSIEYSPGKHLPFNANLPQLFIG